MSTTNDPAAHAPTVRGAPDGEFLTAALRRAGREPPADARAPRSAPLTGGRTSQPVSRLVCGTGPHYVLKRVPRWRAFARGLGTEGEAVFWLAGATRGVPPPLANPTFDVSYHSERDEWWVLMDDVSEGIVARGHWTEQHTLRLFEALAALHAGAWGEPGLAGNLGTPAGTTGVFVETAIYAATGDARTTWAEGAAGEFGVAAAFMPRFLELLGARDADTYLDLCRAWPKVVTALEPFPPTCLHGDTRGANLAFVGDRVVMFDWDFAMHGPAALDLTWHWFLQYWAYPPDDRRRPEDRLWMRDAYLEPLENLLGHKVDREAFNAAWALGWLRVFLQLGFVLADNDDAGDDPELDRRQQVLCRHALHTAQTIADRHAL
ncbi:MULTISPECIES: phosphotransferase family protein [unclassified Thioalkalivibrio]|uniref:phosphotransferase family protein n=1 Tax=unclassified Thioalkalivibrio TaxID=2621013 RepID=UPI001E3ADA19|nr:MULTISPECIES: phosphotransferase [unclassified Thioalkalivibrio]